MKQSRYGSCVFLGGCCYGILSTFVKFAYKAGFTPNEVSGGQYLFGVLIIWLIFLFTKKQKLSLKQVLILLVSGIPFGLTSICYYRALQSLNASLAIIFLFQFVWIGSLFDFIFNHHKPTKQKLISIVILLAGSLLASGVFAQSASFSLTGMLWGILSAFTYTAGMFLSGQVEKDLPPVERSALLSTGGMILIMILLRPDFFTDVTKLTAIAPYASVLGLFGVALPPLLYAIGIPHVGTGLGTILSASELPVAVMMSYFVIGEHIGFMQWLGVLLIILAIIAGNMQPKKILSINPSQR